MKDSELELLIKELSLYQDISDIDLDALKDTTEDAITALIPFAVMIIIIVLPVAHIVFPTLISVIAISFVLLKICKKVIYLLHKTKEVKVKTPSRYKLLKLSEFLFSAKTQKEIFLSTMADWDDEVYEALKKSKNASLFMINVRNTYSFLAAMWQKSLVGDLIQFVVKIAKQ
jgi:hypothetical protein